MKMEERTAKLARRNAIIYGTGGYREYRTPLDGPGSFACYCGTCHRETVTLASTKSECTCYPRRLWSDWDRWHDMTALQMLADRNEWPVDAQRAGHIHSHIRWAGIMKEWLRRARPHDHTLVEEYIMEAEHQEGIDYWWQLFSRPSQVCKDFDIYVESIG